MTSSPRIVPRRGLKRWSLLSALGETSTLHEAAKRIDVTQPSATRILADLESAFGSARFDRRSRGRRATVPGREVAAHARRTQASLDRFLQHLEVKRRRARAKSGLAAGRRGA